MYKFVSRKDFKCRREIFWGDSVTHLDLVDTIVALRTAFALAQQPIHSKGLLCLCFMQEKGSCTIFKTQWQGNYMVLLQHAIFQRFPHLQIHCIFRCVGVPLSMNGSPQEFLKSSVFSAAGGFACWNRCDCRTHSQPQQCAPGQITIFWWYSSSS